MTDYAPLLLATLKRGRDGAQSLCSVGGCSRPWKARLLCKLHYDRWLRHGDPLKVVVPRSVDERWASFAPSEGDGCWEWTGSRNHRGYGVFDLGRATSRLAHRTAWIRAYGPIPAGLSVLHRCDNPPCVRPSHLFLGDHTDNMADARAKGRMRGSRQSNARLTESKVRIVLLLLAEDIPVAQIAALFGVSGGTIYSIQRSKSWTHVQEVVA